MSNMFNRQLMGDFNYSLLIFSLIFFIVNITVLGIALWALLFKVPKKYKKISFAQLGKKFINSIDDESERKKLMFVRKWVLIAFFLTISRYFTVFLIKLIFHDRFFP